MDPAGKKLQVTISGSNTIKNLNYLSLELELPEERVIPYALMVLAKRVREGHKIEDAHLKQILEN